MKSFTFCAVLVFSILSLNCQKREKSDVVNYDSELSYTFFQTHKDSDTFTLTRGELLDKLDLPGDARVDQLTIKAFSVRVFENKGQNTASSAKFNAYLDTPSQPIFKGYEVSFNSLGVTVGSIIPIPINLFIDQGIGSLKNKLKELIKGTRTQLTIIVEGETEPIGSTMALDLTLRLHASISYRYCVTGPAYLGGKESIDCETDVILNSSR